MSLHCTPEDHNADPPSAWTVDKVPIPGTTRALWELRSSLGYVIGSFKTKKAALQDRENGPYVALYMKEARWFRGEPVGNYKPYTQIVAERKRFDAWNKARTA